MNEDIWFMKEPCKHCLFRRDVRPFLTPESGEELAYSTQNPYNDFNCHKTTEYNEEIDDQVVTNRSLTCAGFLSMQLNQSGDNPPEGFTISDKVYYDEYDMIQAYEDPENQWCPEN